MNKVKISQNSVASIYRIEEQDSIYILKESSNSDLLKKEALMLEYLRSHSLRVPKTLFLNEGQLATEYIRNNGSITKKIEKIIAHDLANLHKNSSDYFGFSEDTSIGPFIQPNDKSVSWLEFFAQSRILAFSKECYNENRIDKKLLSRIEKLLQKIDLYLFEPKKSSLIHGDIWGGNILINNNTPYYIDPAIYYAHHEMELAFIAMFHTFSNDFFHYYDELYKIEEGFFQERKDLYNIYPYLVHVRAFGGSYIDSLSAILKRYGV